jgi:hypothetical protein
MFISNKEAEDRLKDGRNIFRDKDVAPSPPGSPTSPSDSRDVRVNKIAEDQAAIELLKQRRQKLSNEEAAISLDHLDHLLSPRIKSRPYTDLNVQAAIAETALVLGDTKTSRIFDRSYSQADRYAHGKTNDFGIEKPELKSRLVQIKERLAEKAADKLDATMNALTPQKISEIKRATNLSRVAKDMASVMDKCSENRDNEGAGVHFHIYRPETVTEKIYETVTVGPAIIDVDSASPQTNISNK